MAAAAVAMLDEEQGRRTLAEPLLERPRAGEAGVRAFGVEEADRSDGTEIESWHGRCGATRAIGRAMLRSFPARRDRVVAVLFALGAFVFMCVQVAAVSARMSRRDSDPVVTASTGVVSSMSPVLGLCATMPAKGSAMLAVMNADTPRGWNVSDTGDDNIALYQEQYPFLEFSFDEQLSELSTRAGGWNASAAMRALFVEQLRGGGIPAADPDKLLAQWGWVDVSRHRMRHDFNRSGFPVAGISGGGAVPYTQRCTAFNVDNLFELNRLGKTIFHVTAMILQPSAAATAGLRGVTAESFPVTLYAAQRGQQPQTVPELDNVNRFFIDADSSNAAGLTLSRRQRIDGTSEDTYVTTGSFLTPYPGNKSLTFSALEVAEANMSLSIAQVTVRMATSLVTETREEPSYSVSLLLSDLGGSLGVITALYAFLFPTLVTLPHQLRLGNVLCSDKRQ